MELGLATFADVSSGVSPEQRMRDLMEEVELADQLGLDVFAVGATCWSSERSSKYGNSNSWRPTL